MKETTKIIQSKMDETEKNKRLPGYPLYPESEDIYTNSQKEQIPDPEESSAVYESNGKSANATVIEKDFNPESTGSDLDVPGAELDDEQEKIGNEDEENNYYSLGGDDHNDLDEDKGD